MFDTTPTDPALEARIAALEAQIAALTGTVGENATDASNAVAGVAVQREQGDAAALGAVNDAVAAADRRSTQVASQLGGEIQVRAAEISRVDERLNGMISEVDARVLLAETAKDGAETLVQMLLLTADGTLYLTPQEGAAATPDGGLFVAYDQPANWVQLYRMVAGVPVPIDDMANGSALRRVGELGPAVGRSSKVQINPSGAIAGFTQRSGRRYGLVGGALRRGDVSGVDDAGFRTDLIGDAEIVRDLGPAVGRAKLLVTDSQSRPMSEYRADVAGGGGAYLAGDGLMHRVGDSAAAVDTGGATLVLAGENALSRIETGVNGYALERWFGPFNTLSDNETLRWLFNPDADIIDGVTIRSSRDDATPDHIFNSTIGANHSWVASVMTANGHGKTADDVGSVWTRTGHDYVLTRVRDANTLLMTSRDSNGAVPYGTFTHVSGATHTGSITASASTAGNWAPPAQDMEMRVLVDGNLVCHSKNGLLLSGAYFGKFSYRESAQFIETYEVLSKAELTSWIETHPTSLYPTGRSPSLRVTNVYEYDRWGGLTLYRSWLFLADVPLSDLMGLQLNAAAAFDPATAQYYIPNTRPFVYNGNTVDYANIEPVTLTINAPGTPSIWFDSSKIEATGPYLTRALALYDSGYVDAAGFLPVGDAADDVRRLRCSEAAMELRGNTGKRYFRLVDDGNRIARAGEYYEMVGFRNVFPKQPGRTAYTVVRSREADYVFADWHNRTGIDTLDMPQDLIGRSFTVKDSRNVSVFGSLIPGRLPVSIDAAPGNASLALRVAK